MSFRDLFAAKAETHSRKRRATQAELIPAQVERLETRALLSAIVPGLNQHGILFTNANVAGRTSLTFDGSINPQISGNVNGAGLFIDINGNTGLRELTLTGLQARNNGSAGAVVNLSNLQLDRLVISSSVFAGNGTAGSGAGLVLQLNNAQIGEIVIANSRFNLNEFSGLQINSAAGTAITSLRALNNRAVQNVAADGMAFLLNGSSVQNLGFANNILQENGTNGFQLKLTNTPIDNLIIRDNVANANQNGHGVFLDFIGSAVTTQIFRNQLTNQAAGDGMRIRTQFSAAGLRNINLAKFSVNTFEGNSGNGFFANLARDTTLRGQIFRNEFRSNGGVGFGASAADTENALDLQIGSFTRVNNELIHRNTFDQNTGAAIALTLQDPSGALGDTTGRIRIFGNTITGTQAGSLPLFTGSGILIRAIGSTVIANGAARWSQVRIDGNTIRNNAGHGVMFDISEDSQLVDAILGNNTGTKLRFDVDGDFSVPGQQIVREPNDGNLIEDNGGNGITILRRDSAVVRDVRILDNVIRRNANGVAIVAQHTFEAVETAATRGNLVSQFVINHNQIRDNRTNGIHLRTEADAVVRADIHYNFIDGNGDPAINDVNGNGIRLSGLENNITDAENIGGTWTKNRISNNVRNGIAIQTVTGTIHPLRIGLDGFDSEFEPFELNNQSLGNFIFGNGEDGIDLTSLAGIPGTLRPFDSISNRVSIVNNQIVENGRNAFAGGGTPDPYTAGKGVDLDNFQGDQREVQIFRNVIQGNAGDGIEIRNGGGTMQVLAFGNIIDLNGGRGVDVLNQTGAVNFSPITHLVFGDSRQVGGEFVNRNQIRSNGLEGFYVVNTSSSNQTQDVDSRTALLADGLIGVAPDLMLDLDRNVIRDNGRGVGDTSSPPSTLSGTGLVVRVGTSNSGHFFNTVPDLSGNINPFTDEAAAGVGTNDGEIGNGRVNARVINNQFSGNAGDDVFMESFTSTVDPPTTPGAWTEKDFKQFEPAYRRDPLARMNLVFTGNTGESMDVNRGFFSTNGEFSGAMYDNAEADFKSRNQKDGANPDGPFQDAGRPRNAQRVADRPVNTGSFTNPLGDFADAYDGLPSFLFPLSQGFSSGGFSGAPSIGPNRPELFTGSIASIDATDPNGPIVVTVAGRSASIFDATNANPSVITSPNHGLFTGDLITITGATGNTAINSSNSSTGEWQVIRVNPNEFRIADPSTGVEVAGNGTYNSGSATWTETGAHGLSTGNLVTIVDSNVPNANGTHIVRVVDIDSFALYVPADVGFFFGSQGTPVPGDGTTGGGGRYITHNPSKFYYDGIGPSTFRVEADWRGTNNFSQNTLGDDFTSTNSHNHNESTSIRWDEVLPGTFTNVTATVGDITVNETAGTATFTVRLSEASKDDVLINYRTKDGTAISGLFDPTIGDYVFDANASDFTSIGGTVVDAISEPGNPSLTRITARNHGLQTGDMITITGAEGRPGINGTWTVTVVNANTFRIPVFSSGIYNPNTAEWTATLRFLPGQTERTVTIDLNNNNSFDRIEEFYLELVELPINNIFSDSGFSGATIVDSLAIATIQPDSDSRPSISINDAAVFPEGRQAVFTVTLSNPSSETIFVDYRTSDGTARDGQDYLERVGTLVFNPGETSKTIEIDTLLDQIVEAPETFQVLLSNAETRTSDGTRVDLTIADSQGVGTIFDTAFVQLPSQVFANGYIQAGSDTSTAEITVKLSRPVPSGQSVTLNYATSNGSATTGNLDYVAETGSVTFNAGDDEATVSITVNRDAIQEGNEFFFVNFTDSGNAVFAEGTDPQVRVVIREPGEVVSLGEGSFPVFRTFDGVSGDVVYQVLALPGSFRGGLRVATGDMNGDGFPDIVAAAGPGGGPAVAIFDGVDGSRIGTPFFALPSTFRGGLTLATGDIDGDGTLEIIVGADAGGAPAVAIFDASGNQIGDHFFPFDMSFRGGVNVAAGDVDGDGRDEIIVGSGPGQTRVVRVYDAENAATTPPTEKFSFEPFGSGGSLGGVVVTAGNVTGSANEEIIVGVQSDGLAGVAVFDGTTGARIGDIFLALPAGFRGGVRVATTQVDGGGLAEVMVGVGPGGGPVVSYYSFNGTTFTKLSQFFAFGRDNRAGIYVAGRGVGPGEGSPLHADGPAPAGTPSVGPISQGDLTPIVDAALDRFESAGLNAGSLEQLGSVEFLIADLGGTLLGLARPGVILIDDDAAGYGWFVDYSPMLDEEFGRNGSGTLTATDSAAAGRMDLLTTVMHELGHELGWTDLDAGRYANDLMTGTLRTGVRRDLDSVFATEDLFDSLLTA